jgi:4-hydroxy-tetrahydrodipicolinate synthase
MSDLVFSGLLPASVLPFDERQRIDEPEVRKVVRWLASVRGLGGIVCNGHAGEVWALDRAQQARVIEIHLEEANGLPIVAGVYANSPEAAALQMADAKAAGADGVLMIPPDAVGNPGVSNPDLAVAWYESVARAVDIPIIAFQVPRARRSWFAPSTLARLAEIPAVVGVKDAVNDIKLYEHDARALKGASRRVAHLNALDRTLLAGFVFGTDGSIIGFGSLVPHWVVAMIEAMRSGDIGAAQAIDDRLYPLVEVLYETPGLPVHAAIKEALHILGVLDKPSISPSPMRALNQRDRSRIRAAVQSSGLAEFGASELPRGELVASA